MADVDRNLAELAHLLGSLAEHPGWPALVEQTDIACDRKTGLLLAGRAKTLEDYRGEAGWVSGARWVLDRPAQLQKALAEEAERARGRA